MVRPALLVLLLVATAACDKAKAQDCDKGARNFFKLHYWELAEAQIAEAPPEKRAKLRIQKQEELEPKMMRSLDLAVQKCVSGADKAQVQCWIKATTAKEAAACEKD